ncbi:hypothetical protein B0H13DRAFT_2557682 [Mycena leptocephala]|nr:hypothetical protein B0H13DRAFT_2557682 [Mycena leptocephala]
MDPTNDKLANSASGRSAQQALNAVPDDSQVSFRDIVQLERKSQLCQSLSISASDHPLLTTMTQAIRSTHFPRLTHFALVNAGGDFDCAWELEHEPVDDILIGMLHSVRDIRLVGFGLVGQDFRVTQLTTLVLRYQHNSASPTIGTLFDTLAASPQLKRLCLERIDSRGEQSGYIGAFPTDLTLELPNLEVLHIDFGHNEDLASLAASIVVPVLSHLTLAVHSESDVEMILECSGLIKSVKSLGIEGHHHGKDEIRALYDVMRHVDTIDLTKASSSFAIGICRPDLPALRNVSLRDASYATIRRLASPMWLQPPRFTPPWKPTHLGLAKYRQV